MKYFWIALAIGIAVVSFPAWTGKAEAARSCPAGLVTCSAWCVKYRPEQKSENYYKCMRGPQGCLTVHGSLNACIRDDPPGRGVNSGRY